VSARESAYDLRGLGWCLWDRQYCICASLSEYVFYFVVGELVFVAVIATVILDTWLHVP
jgi:hypothetical protein